MLRMSYRQWSVAIGLLAIIGASNPSFAQTSPSGAQGGTGTQSGAGAQGGATTHGGAGTQSGTGAQSGAAKAGATGKANSMATTFLTHAAQDGEAEIELGKLAQEKAADMQVKDYGARMQKDHGTANAELQALAAKKGITVPGGPGPHAAMKAKLEKLEGAAFDRAYMSGMVQDHTKAVKEFETASKSADADVKAFAAKTLPTLREHLQMAQQINKALGSSTRSSTSRESPASTGGKQGAGSSAPGASQPGATQPTGTAGTK